MTYSRAWWQLAFMQPAFRFDSGAGTKQLTIKPFRSTVNRKDMRVYAQFYHMSTGYNGTQFSESNKKPIEMCGSDGVFILDARTNLETMKADAISRIQKLSKLRQITGYKIIRATSFLDDGKVIYSSF